MSIEQNEGEPIGAIVRVFPDLNLSEIEQLGIIARLGTALYDIPISSHNGEKVLFSVDGEQKRNDTIRSFLEDLVDIVQKKGISRSSLKELVSEMMELGQVSMPMKVSEENISDVLEPKQLKIAKRGTLSSYQPTVSSPNLHVTLRTGVRQLSDLPINHEAALLQALSAISSASFAVYHEARNQPLKILSFMKNDQSRQSILTFLSFEKERMGNQLFLPDRTTLIVAEGAPSSLQESITDAIAQKDFALKHALTEGKITSHEVNSALAKISLNRIALVSKISSLNYRTQQGIPRKKGT